MKAVMDTNVLVSALFWRGAPFRCLLAAKAGLYDLVFSEEILVELKRVLVEKFRLSNDEAEESLSFIRELGQAVKVTEKLRAVAKDPDDDKFLEAAVSAGAEIVVTGDRHLLELHQSRTFRS